MPPTQHPVEIHAVDILKVLGERVARASTYSNGLELMTELGAFKLDKPVVPPPGYSVAPPKPPGNAGGIPPGPAGPKK